MHGEAASSYVDGKLAQSQQTGRTSRFRINKLREVFSMRLLEEGATTVSTQPSEACLFSVICREMPHEDRTFKMSHNLVLGQYWIKLRKRNGDCTIRTEVEPHVEARIFASWHDMCSI